MIPGNVGYWKQFFSAQLFVANGAPSGSGLTVRDVTGEVILPKGADSLAGTEDDPLSLARVADQGEPSLVVPVRNVGADGQPGSGDDGAALAPGEFWEIKFHKNFGDAVDLEQINKHLMTKILPDFEAIARQFPNPKDLAAELAKVKLKFNFVVEVGGSLADRKLMHESVEFLLREDFPDLVQAGFKFELDDIVVRVGNPLNVLNWILPAPLR